MSIKDDQILMATEAEVWQELEKYFGYDMRQPGDISINDIAKQFQFSDETARVKMNGLVKKGLFKRVRVRDKEKIMTVYRRVRSS